MQEQIMKGFELIFSKLGYTTNVILSEYVKYYYIQAWAYLSFGIFSGLLGCVIGFIVFGMDDRAIIKDPAYVKDKDELSSKSIGVVVVLLALLIAGIVVMSNVSIVLAPQAYAIKTLIQELR